MSTDSKIKYQKFCTTTSIVPVFSQGWWLDAVCGTNSWDVCVYEKSGQVIGAWVYYKVKKMGQPMFIMPPLTKFLGLYIDYPDNLNTYSRNSLEKEIIASLIKKIPYAYVKQNFHYRITNWLPFYWAGFQSTINYSYILDPVSQEQAFQGIKSSTRRDIKKAQEILKVVQTDDPKNIYDLVKKTYSAKKKPTPYTYERLHSLDKACKKNACSKMFLAVDKDENIHAGIYLVWDTNSYYYLIGGLDPKFKGSNASTLLIWHGIQEAMSVNKCFDFEGSMVESIERYFRSFGATQKPYFSIEHSSKMWLKIYFSLKSISFWG